MKIKDFAIRDWWKPILAGVLSTGLSILIWASQRNLCIVILSDEVLKITFTYATTMFGLLMAAYTILQGFTNERTEKLKKWTFFTRYKMILVRTLRILVILGVGSIIAWVAKGIIPLLPLLVILSFAVGMVVFTLVATFEWVYILIKNFDSNTTE